MRPLILRVLFTVALSFALARPASAQAQMDQLSSSAFAQFRPVSNLPTLPASVSQDPDDQRRRGTPWEEIVGVAFIVLTVGGFIGIFLDHS